MSFENEPYEYCLDVYGPMFSEPSVAGEGLKQGKHFFNTVSELWYFFAELQIMAHKLKAPAPLYTTRDGRHVRYHTVAIITYTHDFITYQVEVKNSFVTDHEFLKARFSAPDCGFGCDCSRAQLIRIVSADFPLLMCGHTIELLTVKIEDRK